MLKATSTLPQLLAGREKTISDNQAAFGRRPPANPNPNVHGPNPRDWYGNRPFQPEATPPAIKKF